jgi:hypothetical protein
MATELVDTGSLIDAAQRATGMVVHRAMRAHDLAVQAQAGRDSEPRKSTRAAEAAALAELEELTRTLHAAARLARAAVAALDDELTRGDGASMRPLSGERRTSERRDPFRDRRSDTLNVLDTPGDAPHT